MARRVTHRGLAHISRLRVLDAVQADPGISLSELAARTDLHTNTVRDHVDALRVEGLIVTEHEHRGTRGRPRVLVHPVTKDQPSEASLQRIEQAKQHGDLLRRIVPETAPSHLDRDAVHQLDALYEHLDDTGLEPDLDEQNMQVTVVPCPFHELIDNDQTLVCRVHERLIVSVLEQTGGPVELDRLLPLVTPHSCLVHLRIAQAERGATDAAAGATGNSFAGE